MYWTNVAAQGWPAKPIRAIAPVAAGSSPDIVPRLVFVLLSTRLGQTILVENRTGAGGQWPLSPLELYDKFS